MDLATFGNPSMCAQWLHCMTVAAAGVASTLVAAEAASEGGRAKRVAADPATAADADVRELLRDPRLEWVTGARINSFISGSVGSFLFKGLPGKVLQGLADATLEHVYELLNTGITDFPERLSGVHLLYSSTRDGATPQAFHECCDNQGATLVLVKDTDGYVFGGFTQGGWSSSGGWVVDPNAFLISVTSPHGGAPVLFPSANGTRSVLHMPRCGPCFGGGLFVYGSKAYSWSHIDTEEYLNFTGRGPYEALTGAMIFEPSLVEVYRL